MQKLTKRTIDAVEPSEKEVLVWDSELRGFGFRVRPSGHRSFIVQFRNPQNRTRKIKLGDYGRLTPDEARKAAREILAAVERGEDPAEERDQERTAETVAELAADYLERHLIPKKRESTVKEFSRLLEKVILPRLGKRKVSDLTRRDVEAFHRDLSPTPVTANRVLTLLSILMVFAERLDLRPVASNPCRFVERYPEEKRERFLSAEELGRLGQTLTESEGTELPSAILALRLLCLSGMRRGEVLGLRWDYVDLSQGVINLPTSKTGAKRVLLGAPALELLSKAQRIEGNPFVVYGERPGAALVGLQKIWERLREKAGLENVRIHDLRHGFASVGAANGESLLIVGRLLGHATAAMTERYSHLSANPLRGAADRISGHIASAMDGNHAGGEVIAFRGA